MATRPGGDRIWLDVAYADKDAAKALGARWDPAARRWHAPPGREAALAQWAALPEVPALLPGEDRTVGSILEISLVPASCWFSNVRSCTAPRDWERLRRMLLVRAGNRCEICGIGEDRELRRWLEAHERWAYDNEAGVQTLKRLIIICTNCHETTHFGLAEVRGRGEDAFGHLCAVTGMSSDQGNAHVEAAYAVWRARSARDWALDLSILTGAGITLAPPPANADRAEIAAHRLTEQRQTEQRQTEQRQAEQRQAEQGLAEQRQAEQGLAGQRQAEQGLAEQGLAEQGLAEQGRAVIGAESAAAPGAGVGGAGPAATRWWDRLWR